ncbi:Gamma-butyrobetaine dioxygenase [Labrenzia sp. THAF82]|uniref:TauD/TfdA family dioxygenase n=1 Tax=Labrenzia sp. THAF82 TaxID=2587861 RepID=UPI001268A486|nr:TauD/TfdA family dioxygenase [Labrenzia sp. THAF82]QFT33245.1 Gamma-butyrobetaine dioxygenase [Labrenzia sp. THAF82]
MTSISLRGDDRVLHVAWGDGTSADFPFVWLRDNCPSGFHPQTQEREFDLTSIPMDISVSNADLEAKEIVLTWNHGDHVSRFDSGWLRKHRPGFGLKDPAQIEPTLWRGDLPPATLPRADAQDLLINDSALLEFLTETKKTGLSIVTGMADDSEAGMTVARRIGFLRQTNFGTTFEVMSKPNPNNLAYTSHALPLHTDLANQELPPGFQFLHCLANEADGGGSTFCDGFAIASDLRKNDPETFRLLAETPVPFRFHDTDFDIRRHQTVIDLDPFGRLQELHFNAHLAGIFDLPAEVMETYYRAYRTIMKMTRSDDYVITTRLNGGEMVIFDNRRVLHGRASFDPNTGFRHLRGCYVDRGEFDSRIRVLSRES